MLFYIVKFYFVKFYSTNSQKGAVFQTAKGEIMPRKKVTEEIPQEISEVGAEPAAAPEAAQEA